MALPHPIDLATRQLASDHDRTREQPDLLIRKHVRMCASPFGFLRGSAPMYWQLLADHPELQEGPGGAGWLVGDLHLENFGAFRPDAPVNGDHGDKAAFGINDFDDATQGPWRLDLLRLATSLLLNLHQLQVDGVRAVQLTRVLVDAWAEAIHGEPLQDEPACVTALLDKVRHRSRKDLLDARTTVKGDNRFLLRGDRYLDLSPELAGAARHAFSQYVQSLDGGPDPEAFRVLDMAFRVAGTGSLGGLRIAVLVQGKGGRDGAWLFDMKAQGPPSTEALLPTPANLEPAQRVLDAMRACLDQPLKLAGTTRLGADSMLVRRLTPQEDRLDWRKLDSGEVEPLVRYLGALTGLSHGRGMTEPPATWDGADRRALVDRAIALCGLHVGTWLALCRLVG